MPADDSDLAQVRLLGVPLRLRARATQHGEELLRELTLVQIGAQQHVADSAPQRLLDVAARLQETYGAFTVAGADALDAAEAAGREHADVTYEVPRHIAPFLAHVRVVLAEAEDYCRRGEHLLTLAPPDDVVAYRTWTFDEVERQIAGEPPTPWPRARQQAGREAR
ncbi:hypothetical protein [Kineococcus glutinatus]|uniref:hypothetical protein n=1 Tax=Kineococcus glutinatus TaxID=1070872 RepID=UPI0031E891A0